MKILRKDRHSINKYRHQYRNDSYDRNRGRSRERHCSYYARKVPNSVKLELFDKVVCQLDLNKDMTTRFIKTVSGDVDDLFDNTSTVAEVVCWMVKRLRYARTPEAEDLAKDPHVNISSTASQNYESINVDLVDTKSIEESKSNSEEAIQF